MERWTSSFARGLSITQLHNIESPPLLCYALRRTGVIFFFLLIQLRQVEIARSQIHKPAECVSQFIAYSCGVGITEITPQCLNLFFGGIGSFEKGRENSGPAAARGLWELLLEWITSSLHLLMLCL